MQFGAEAFIENISAKYLVMANRYAWSELTAAEIPPYGKITYRWLVPPL